MSGRRRSVVPLLRVRADAVMLQLRQCGVVVHQAAPMPIPGKRAADGEASLVLFLSKTQAQYEIARKIALRIPWVKRVTFSGYCPSTMFVYVDLPRRRP